MGCSALIYPPPHIALPAHIPDKHSDYLSLTNCINEFPLVAIDHPTCINTFYVSLSLEVFIYNSLKILKCHHEYASFEYARHDRMNITSDTPASTYGIGYFGLQFNNVE